MPIASVLHILHTIKDRGPMSRTDLQQVTGLSWGTVTNTTRELLTRRFIREQGAVSTRAGRKPVQLAINTVTHCLTGVEMLPQSCRVTVLDMMGEVLWQNAATLPEGPGEAAWGRIADLAAAGHAAAAPRTPLGVGVVLPVAAGDAASLTHPADEMAARLRTLLHARLQLPIYTEQSANALALAHRWFGPAALGGCDDLICVHLGDDVELGILAAGDIFRGHAGQAGQLAHVSLDPTGPLCVCGKRGCVAASCTLPALLSAAADPIAGAPRSLEELLSRATQEGAGRAQALDACERFGAVLGSALLMLVDLLDPALLVLAGRTTAAASFFMPALERQMASRAHSVRVLVSPLSDVAPALGVAALVLQNAFETPAPPAITAQALPA